MRTEEFKDWLESYYPEEKSKGTITTRISNCKRLEDSYGNLDIQVKRDKGISMFSKLTYSTDDEKEGREPNHNILIEGNIRNGTATLKQAFHLYIQFCEEQQP